MPEIKESHKPLPGVELVILRPRPGEAHHVLYLGKRSPGTWAPLVVLGWHRDAGTYMPVFGAWRGFEIAAYPPRNLGSQMRGPKFTLRTRYLRRRRVLFYIQVVVAGMFDAHASIQTRRRYE